MKALARAAAAAWICSALCLGSGACASFYIREPNAQASARPDAQRTPVAEALPAMSATEAAAMAIANDSELKAARDELTLKEGAWALGFRAYLPFLELSAGSDERLSAFGPDSFSKTLSASLGQTVWDGGRLRAARALEASALTLARAELERKAADRGEAAVSAYRSVVSARARLGVKRASLRSAETERVILATEIGLGLAKASDAMEAELRLKGMELEIAESELELSIAEEELSRALGVATLPEPSERLGTGRDGLAMDPDALAALAVARSPELELARHAVAEKRARARAASFSWLPTVVLKASGQVSGSRPPLTRATWSIGLSLDFTGPYASGSSGSSGGREATRDKTAMTSAQLRLVPDPALALEKKSAELSLRVEEEQYSAERAKVELSARSAVAAYRHALKKRDIASEALSLSELDASLALTRVALGKAVRTEVFAAELRRAACEIDLVDAAAGLIAAERRIERLLGIPPASLALFLEAAAIEEPRP